jgi:hypothetical protein
MFTRRIDIDTHRVYIEPQWYQFFFQFTLIHIVLVLAYANGFWVNFTNSANGSLNRRPIEIDPRTVTS